MWRRKALIALVLGCVGCAADSDKTPARCGNGILDADENCDGALIKSGFVCGDGQQPTGCNACVPECSIPSSCGNGILDAGEECDGPTVPDCPSGTLGAVTCSATCEPDMSGCAPEGGTVVVHVVEGTMPPSPSVYVVSHKPDGTPITECYTDATGRCVFTGVPADAMITVGYTELMGTSSRTHFLTTFTHVNAPQTIEYVIPAPLPSSMSIAAHAYVPGPYTGATNSITMNGCGNASEFTDFTSVHEHGFWDQCLDANHEGVVYAEARSASGTPLAWSYLRQPVVAETTFTLPAWSASFSMLTTQITNVPSTMATLRLECNAVIDHLAPLMRRRDVTPPASTEPFAMPVPSSPTTSARCSVTVGLSAQPGSQFCERRQTPPFTQFAFDASELLPPLTSTFTANSGTPIDHWSCTLSSQPTPAGDVSDCFKGFVRNGTPTTFISWHLIAPGDFVGTVTAPQLPSSAPFLLTLVEAPPGFENARRWAYSDVTGYSDYLDGRVEPMTGETCAVFHAPN